MEGLGSDFTADVVVFLWGERATLQTHSLQAVGHPVFVSHDKSWATRRGFASLSHQLYRKAPSIPRIFQAGDPAHFVST